MEGHFFTISGGCAYEQQKLRFERKALNQNPLLIELVSFITKN